MPHRTVHNCREVKWGWSKETETKQFDQMNRPFKSNDIICQITTSMKICLIDEKTTAVNKQQMSIIPSIKNDEEK